MGDEVRVRDGRTRSVWLVSVSSGRPGSEECGAALYACLTAAVQCQQRMEYTWGWCSRVVEEREDVDV